VKVSSSNYLLLAAVVEDRGGSENYYVT